jgi:hypothetical protein
MSQGALSLPLAFITRVLFFYRINGLEIDLFSFFFFAIFLHVKQNFKNMVKEFEDVGGEKLDRNHADRILIEPVDLFLMIVGLYFRSVII